MVTEAFKKVVYFDKETIGNILQQQNGGQLLSTGVSGSTLKASANLGTEAQGSVNLPVPLIARIKFAFTGKLDISYIRERQSKTTITSTDLSEFKKIKNNLTPFSNQRIHGVKNSLTSMRMAAGYITVTSEEVQGIKPQEMRAFLDSLEGYSTYEIDSGQYIRFNNQSFVSNYKQNDILLSHLDLFCVEVGKFQLDDFDYLKQVQNLPSLFNQVSDENKTLSEIYPIQKAAQKEPVGSELPVTPSGETITLYDAIFAQVSGE